MKFEPSLVSFETLEPVLHRVKAGLDWGWRRTVCGKDATSSFPSDVGRYCEICFRR